MAEGVDQRAPEPAQIGDDYPVRFAELDPGERLLSQGPVSAGLRRVQLLVQAAQADLVSPCPPLNLLALLDRGDEALPRSPANGRHTNVAVQKHRGWFDGGAEASP
jgi:hypothetical protein